MCVGAPAAAAQHILVFRSTGRLPLIKLIWKKSGAGLAEREFLLKGQKDHRVKSERRKEAVIVEIYRATLKPGRLHFLAFCVAAMYHKKRHFWFGALWGQKNLPLMVITHAEELKQRTPTEISTAWQVSVLQIYKKFLEHHRKIYSRK